MPETEERHGHALDRPNWVVVLRVLICFLKVEIIGEVIQEDHI